MEQFAEDNSPIVAIDASRNRSGGSVAHLLGILGAVDPRELGIKAVHVWSYSELLLKLPDYPWLVKHCPSELNLSLLHQVWWQLLKFPKEIRSSGCNILLSTDAGTVAKFKPSVVMSRDMLSFEGNEMLRYPLFSFSRIRLLLLKWLQIRSFRNATAVIFLTKYAADIIQHYTNRLQKYRVINHGVSDNFRRNHLPIDSIDTNNMIECTYVSNADFYKHQWYVVEAIAMLRKDGFNVCLNLIGAGTGAAYNKVLNSIKHTGIDSKFVQILPAQNHALIPKFLFQSDIFIFASSCENMPNTLIEAMAAGLPIACSNRGPMPEVLADGGIYFDPEKPTSIYNALKKLITNDSLRQDLSRIASQRSKLFSWQRCAKETWLYLIEVLSERDQNSNIK